MAVKFPGLSLPDFALLKTDEKLLKELMTLASASGTTVSGAASTAASEGFEAALKTLKTDDGDSLWKVWADSEKAERESWRKSWAEREMTKPFELKSMKTGTSSEQVLAIKRTNSLILRDAAPFIDAGDSLTPEQKFARAMERLGAVERVDDGLRWAEVWSQDHHEAFKLAWDKRVKTRPRVPPLAEVCSRLATPDELDDKIKGLEADMIWLDEAAELERTLTPRSEHSSEADLQRALEHQALVEDPEYGNW